MTPDNYKQSFTDDFKQEESCKIKIKKKKKVFEIRQKKYVILQRVLYKHVHKYHNCKCCIITIHIRIYIYNSIWYN